MIGEITNRGIEAQGMIGVGPLTVDGWVATVASRVKKLAASYTGDLRVGDRVPEVPRTTAAQPLTPLSELRVTARRRVESLEDLPAGVSVVPGEQHLIEAQLVARLVGAHDRKQVAHGLHREAVDAQDDVTLAHTRLGGGSADIHLHDRWPEIARGEDVRIGPHPVLGIVREEGQVWLGSDESVAEVSAGGIACL